MNPIDTIIFDVDGTLVDTSQDIWRSINRALTQWGHPSVTYEEVRRYIGPGAEHLVRSLLPPGADNVQEVLSRYRSIYGKHCLEETDFYPGMKEVIERFAHLNLTVATNKPRDITEKVLEGLGVMERFKAILGPEDVVHLKPHPEMVQKVLARVHTVPERAIMVGDTANDILAAKAAKTRSCGVTFGYNTKEAVLKQNPDFVVDDAAELEEVLEGCVQTGRDA